MLTYRALWVDDQWESVKVVPGNMNLYYDAVMREFEGTNNRIIVTTIHQHGEMWPELDRYDYRIVILDYDFAGQTKHMRQIVDELQKRNLPYVMFTQYFDECSNDPIFKKKDLLRRAIIDKKAKGERKLASLLRNFFDAPPIRLVHISDIHYDSKVTGDLAEARDRRLDSLVNTLAQEHKSGLFDAIALTGDFSKGSPESDLLGVRETVHKIVSRTIGKANLENLLIVPGNHDLQYITFPGVLAPEPWAAYSDFYKNVFGTSLKLLRESKNPGDNTLTLGSRPQWHRHIVHGRLNVLGFCTPSMNLKHIGKGEFGKADEDFTKERWSTSTIPGEIRLALMHHNLYSVLSVDPLEEKHILINSGKAIHVLMSHLCDVVLSGHTHSTGALSTTAWAVKPRGFHRMGKLAVFTSGTASGIHPSEDHARSFNIIDFLEASEETLSRPTKVQPFFYDPTSGTWLKGQPMDTFVGSQHSPAVDATA